MPLLDEESLLLDDSELLLLLSESESEEESVSEDEEESDDSTSCFCVIIIFGAFLRCSRSSSLINKKNFFNFFFFGRGRGRKESKYKNQKSIPHVSPPRPIEVKKLMAKRVFLGLSRGNNPSKKGCNVLMKTNI